MNAHTLGGNPVCVLLLLNVLLSLVVTGQFRCN